MSEGRRLGALLVQARLLSQEKLEAALVEQAVSGEMLGRILVDKGLVAESDLVSVLAAQVGYEFVDLSEYRVDPTAPTIVTESLARRYGLLPIGWDGERLVVAMADPSNVFALDDVRSLANKDLKVVVATKTSILEAIGRYHRMGEGAEDISALAAGEEETDDDLAHLTEASDEAPIVRLINMLIIQAVEDRASDIHIEPTEQDLRIRYRIDGVLHEVMRPAKSIQAAVVSRLKIMANVDIAERRVPQDGRVNVKLKGRAVDLRVATLPTVYGEKVVMRILDKSKAVLKLADLGFLDASMERFEASYRKPSGTILVTGPTGSGKSTTLAAVVDKANRSRADHIMTVEDPIEFLHEHKQCLVNQREVGEDTWSFKNALKHVLRQDPDIILVGEMRDLETIEIALTAAETGHLVMATLHTQDAAQTIDRIIDVFPPSQQQQVRVMLSGALQGVVCQQLVPTADGKGRVVAVEVMTATPAIRNLIREGKTHQIYSTLQAGAKHGMQTMDSHLAQLVRQGRVTYDAALEKCHHVEDFNRLCGRG